MGTPFSPTRKEVEQYRRLRALSRDLNSKMITTVPHQAYDDIGDALGILRDGTLVFETEDMSGVFMDCCLYDWFENGKNLVRRYAETHPAKPGTGESCLLNAFTRAKYRILLVKSAVPEAGVYCHDILADEDLFLMDMAFSRIPNSAGAMLATRTMPLGEYWMTGGAALPVNNPKAVRRALDGVEDRERKSFEDPDSVALFVVRACLATGAAGHIRYEGGEREPRKPRRR
jgi:hypothetical protein